MSLASATNRISYTGNGNVDTYAYTFRIFANTDLLVTVRDLDDEETTLTLSTHYTVTGVGAESGGNVVLVNGSFDWLDGDGDLKSGYILSIRRVRPLTQTTDIRNQGDFFPEIHEDAFDHFIMVDQQQQDELDRSIRLPETIDPDDFSNALPAGIADAAGMALIVNADGDGFDLGTLETAGIETIPFNNVEYKAFADSPITLTSGANGIVYTVDTSGGAVSITLPSISALNLSLPFSITVLKSTSDTNAVTINRASTDTFNPGAGTSKTISKQGRGYVLIPDADASPDQWTCLPVSDPTIVGDYEADVIHTTDQGSDPATPSSGKYKLYSKTAGIFYIDSSGNVRQLANLAEAQVFTNKDYDGGTASNTSRITVPKNTLSNLSGLTRKEGTIVYATDTDKLYKDDGTSLTEIGSGSGGAINYILNPDAESATTGWATYADAAGTSPVDGTGGSPTATLTRTTTTPLRGTGSFLFTKDAANRQGEGASYAFTIDSADKAKVLSISFDYEIASGTFVSGDSSDLRVWVYDVTNSALIPVAPYTIQGGGSSQHKFQGVFQTASNSTSYRLILHIATTSSSAYTFEFDNVVVGPQQMLYGAPISDWTAYTPTYTSFGTVSNNSGFYRRVGDSLEVIATVTVGTCTAAIGSIALPNGLSIDTAKIGVNATTSADGQAVGTYGAHGTTGDVGLLTANTSTSATVVYFGGIVTSATNLRPGNANSTVSNSQVMSLRFLVPIAGWSSTVLMSNDTDTRVVTMRASSSTTTVNNSANGTIIFPTKTYDSHGAYDTSTGIYTVPVSGKYYIKSGFQGSAAIAASGADTRLVYSIIKGASTTVSFRREPARSTSSYTPVVEVSDEIDLVVGDTIKMNLDNNLGSNITGDGGATSTYLVITRISGPSAIAATETVSCTASTNAGQTVTAGGDATIVFEDENHDTHGMNNISNGNITIPVSGKYFIEASIMHTDAAWTAGNTLRLQVNVDGSIVRQTFEEIQSSVTMNKQIAITHTMSLLAGQVITIHATHDRSGGNTTLITDGQYNCVHVHRIGN